MISRPNRVLVVVVAAIALVAVAAAVLTARRATTYGAGTPEGVVQRYVTAVVDGDHQSAAALLSPQSPCTIGDLDRSRVPEGARVTLLSTRVTGATAQVEIEVVAASGDLFGGDGFSDRHTLRLARSGTDWRIVGEPWPLYGCFRRL
jgi:hypothetical protein